jgi:hypothetical protein
VSAPTVKTIPVELALPIVVPKVDELRTVFAEVRAPPSVGFAPVTSSSWAPAPASATSPMAVDSRRAALMVVDIADPNAKAPHWAGLTVTR